MKNSKASNACAVLSQNVKRLLRTLVFEKTMEVYRSVKPSSDDAAARRLIDADPEPETIFEENFGWLVVDVAVSKAENCQTCLNFQWDLQDASVNTQKVFCQNILNTLDPDSYSEDDTDSMMNFCMDFFQCQTQATRLGCCQYHKQCEYTLPPDCSTIGQGDPYICKLSCYSGSCENYWFQAETKAECDTASTVRGCGGCKDKGASNTLVQKDRKPVLTDGFVSLCVGGLVSFPKPIPDCVDQRLC